MTRADHRHPEQAVIHGGFKLGLAGLIATIGSTVFLLATADDSWPDNEGAQSVNDFTLALMTRIPGVNEDRRETDPVVGAEPVGLGKPDFSKDAPRFIVRFKNQTDLERALARYRKDKGAAEDAYAKWATSQDAKDQIRQFRLAGATYSGEAILEYVGPENIKPSTNRAIAKALSEHPDISYADPDFSAKPGNFE